jgi:hypothetical protein
MADLDLVEQLRAALDTVEAHAQKDLWALDRATPGRWEAHYGHNLPYSLIKGEGGVEIARFVAETAPLPDGSDDLHAADILLVTRLVVKARERAETALRTHRAHREILDWCRTRAPYADPVLRSLASIYFPESESTDA